MFLGPQLMATTAAAQGILYLQVKMLLLEKLSLKFYLKPYSSRVANLVASLLQGSRSNHQLKGTERASVTIKDDNRIDIISVA